MEFVFIKIFLLGRDQYRSFDIIKQMKFVLLRLKSLKTSTWNLETISTVNNINISKKRKEKRKTNKSGDGK